MSMQLPLAVVHEWRGTGTVSGITRVLTSPGVYEVVPYAEVVLMDQDALRARATMRSGLDGSFSFQNLDTGRPWMVLAIHPSGAYSAVITDRLQP
jgi:hypothetical protein